jgi:type III pantothenate kinase
MLLTIDVGNTNLTLGLYMGKSLETHWRLATDHERMPDEYGLQILGLLSHSACLPDQLEGISLSSVVPLLTSRVIQACRQYLKIDPLVINHELNTGVKILYDNPAAVGTDRIADAAAAVTRYGAPVIVVDFGTATTFNAINRHKEYLGGAIAPGILTAAQSLTQRAAKISPVDLTIPPGPIGRNTPNALQSGLLYGYAYMVDGMVNRFKKELGDDTKVIATGGLAETIAPLTESFTFVDPWLTLDGLRILWEMNPIK